MAPRAARVRPQPLIDMVGLSLREALPVVVDKLIEIRAARAGAGDRLRQADGARNVAWALCPAPTS